MASIYIVYEMTYWTGGLSPPPPSPLPPLHPLGSPLGLNLGQLSRDIGYRIQLPCRYPYRDVSNFWVDGRICIIHAHSSPPTTLLCEAVRSWRVLSLAEIRSKTSGKDGVFVVKRGWRGEDGTAQVGWGTSSTCYKGRTPEHILYLLSCSELRTSTLESFLQLDKVTYSTMCDLAATDLQLLPPWQIYPHPTPLESWILDHYILSPPFQPFLSATPTSTSMDSIPNHFTRSHLQNHSTNKVKLMKWSRIRKRREENWGPKDKKGNSRNSQT